MEDLDHFPDNQEMVFKHCEQHLFPDRLFWFRDAVASAVPALFM